MALILLWPRRRESKRSGPMTRTTTPRLSVFLENLAEFHTEAKWQCCVVHFYRKVWTALPMEKVKEGLHG